MNKMVEEDMEGIANEINLMNSCKHPSILTHEIPLSQKFLYFFDIFIIFI